VTCAVACLRQACRSEDLQTLTSFGLSRVACLVFWQCRIRRPVTLLHSLSHYPSKEMRDQVIASGVEPWPGFSNHIEVIWIHQRSNAPGDCYARGFQTVY
jgi:hypothetical protein